MLNETGSTIQEESLEQPANYHIFVYYTSTNEDEELNRIKNMIWEIFKNINGVCLVVPTVGDNRLECINPVYITDEELLRKHRILLEELHEHIKFRLS